MRWFRVVAGLTGRPAHSMNVTEVAKLYQGGI
jgi:hypothetical protein